MPTTPFKTYEFNDLSLTTKLLIQSIIGYEAAVDTLTEFNYFDKDPSLVLENFGKMYKHSIYLLLECLQYPKEDLLIQDLYSIYYKEEGTLLILTSDTKEFILRVELN